MDHITATIVRGAVVQIREDGEVFQVDASNVLDMVITDVAAEGLYIHSNCTRWL